ncbi:hypothetical protein ABZ319_34195 [Nocardia sp. NPDC005978]|uniref:hypothetical protein n=1 Tax=Nocardia sp. NPDC005978 TaxID=3156725 RepID=UPI0033A3C427
MGSWRENASAAAQSDLDALLDAALEMAEGRLAQRGEFYPFGLGIDADGRTEVIAVMADSAQQAQGLVYQSLRARRSEFRAAVIAADVRLPQSSGDAVDLYLEHSEGTAINVLEPYRIVDGEVAPESLRAYSADRRIWL